MLEATPNEPTLRSMSELLDASLRELKKIELSQRLGLVAPLDSSNPSGSPPVGSPVEEPFQIGTKVRIFDVQRKPELNGEVGAVTDDSEVLTTGRVVVRLESTSKRHAVHVKNLQKVVEVVLEEEDDGGDADDDYVEDSAAQKEDGDVEQQSGRSLPRDQDRQSSFRFGAAVEVEGGCLEEASGGYSVGAWERHTKGVGSKLMAKMGFVRGKGLGAQGQGVGRAPPIVVLPQVLMIGDDGGGGGRGGREVVVVVVRCSGARSFVLETQALFLKVGCVEFEFARKRNAALE
jgi:hypothetical protein